MNAPEAEPVRRPHAFLDPGSRHHKALKIERLLGLEQDGRRLRLLDIGTGSGVIAAHFVHHPSGRFEVDAIDQVDARVERAGYRYATVQGATLPFPDASFDLVLSNHVIEHVGGWPEQRAHLDEIRRVLKPDGRCYLACPSRWMIVEAHYRLAFLSWLPRPLRTPYLRFFRRGEHYDCEPRGPFELPRLIRAAGFTAENLFVPALVETFEIERPGSAWLPWLRRAWVRALLRPLRALSPTLLYVLRRG